jgi:renalase
MASRRTDDRVADVGASYFTVSDLAFEAVVQNWHGRGLARRWTDTFLAIDGPERTEKSGPMRWAAPGGLRGLVEDLAEGLDVREQTVTSVGPGLRVDGVEAPAVVLAMPDPQARRLLDPSYAAEIEALTDPYLPVLALTARWSQRSWPEFDGAFVASDPIVAWIADDGRRRGDAAPVLVAHSTSEFAAEHLAAPAEAAPLLALAVRDALDIYAEPVSTHVQRWSFAKPVGMHAGPFFLGEALVGLCGDSWSAKPRVEAAYLSGRAVGTAVADRLR